MSLLNDLTLPQLLTRLVAFLVVIAIHGFAIAGLARLLGDQTPKYNGRLTPSPFAHLAMPALVMAVLFRFSWIPPIKLKPENLRWGRFGLVLVAIGALAVTLLTVPLLQLVRATILVSLPRSAALMALLIVEQIQDLSIWFVTLNWLPLPLLTGSLVAFAGVPALERPYLRYRNVFMAVLIASIVAGIAEAVLSPLHDWLFARLVG